MPSVVSSLCSSELGVEVTTGLYGDPCVTRDVEIGVLFGLNLVLVTVLFDLATVLDLKVSWSHWVMQIMYSISYVSKKIKFGSLQMFPLCFMSLDPHPHHAREHSVCKHPRPLERY